MHEAQLRLEEAWLSPYAAQEYRSKGRAKQEPPCPYRTEYARDRDRIIHCNAFRRLKQKTQVFLSPQGDHFRTRLTHTLEVAQIARTIARCLRLNEDLTEAIALGHDLGHTPFGHAGERALNELAPFRFTHAAQSVRVVERLERGGQGLNLTWEVRNGIACHGSATPDAATLEGKVVEYADKIAYINHDIEDAVRAGLLTEEELPYDCTYLLGRGKSARISTMIGSIVQESAGKDHLAVNEELYAAHLRLRKFMFDNVYTSPAANGEEGKAHHLLGCLYHYYCSHPEELPSAMHGVLEQEGVERAVCDCIAGMTDSFAVERYRALYLPKFYG